MFTLATEQVGVMGIAVDTSNVYWTTWGACGTVPCGTVAKVPLGGGLPVVLASSQNGPSSVAVNDTNVVFWASGGGVMSVSIEGGTPTRLAPNWDMGGGIAVNATTLYWPGTLQGTVHSVPVGGYEGGPMATPVDPLAGYHSITLDSTSVYWTSSQYGTVMKAPLDLGSTTTLFSGQSTPSGQAWTIGSNGVAVDDTDVYWVNGAAGTIMSVPKAGGLVMTLASGQLGPVSIAVDRTSVYWTNYGSGVIGRQSDGADGADGAVMKMAAAGRSPEVLAAQNGPYAIAVDDKSVYWTNFGDQTIRKLTPK